MVCVWFYSNYVGADNHCDRPGAKLRAMRRKYEAMMAGSGVEDLEGLLIDLKNQSDMLEEEQREQKPY